MTGRAATISEKRRFRRRESSTRGRAGVNLSPRTLALIIASLLVLATVALYYPVSSHGFLNYDDDIYVINNPQVHAGLSWETLKWAFTSFHASNWHPLTWLSHAADYQMFGLDAGRHHDTNLLLHVLNVLLLFWVLWRATDYVGRSAAIAALFALHPINVESVAWIAERKNLLSMMFFLLALGAYAWYAQRPRLPRYLLVAAFYALGLMAKPQVITFPLVLLLWDYWPLQRIAVRYSPFALGQSDSRSSAPKTRAPGASDSPTLSDEQRIANRERRSPLFLIVEKLPLLAMSAASAVVTIRAQYESGSMTGAHWQPLHARIENAIVAYARYLGKAFWPSHLVILYPHPGDTLPIWQPIAALLLLLAITALVIAAGHRRRYLLVGWLWFMGAMVPMIGLVQVGVQSMADRYAYLPFVGLFIMMTWGAADWADHQHIPRAWQVGTALAILLALAVVARRQLDQWRDNNLLWWQVIALETQALQTNPNNWVAHDVLAHVLLKMGQVDEAMPHFRAAVAINPLDPDSNVNVGAYEQRQNNLTVAIEQYKKVIAITQATPRQDAQNRAQAFSNLGFAYRDLGDYAQARESFEQAVAINPDDARSWLGIGLMAQKAGDLSAAVQAYNKTLKIAPLDWGYLLLARALDQQGRATEAEAARRHAAAISQNMEQARKAADAALAK